MQDVGVTLEQSQQYLQCVQKLGYSQLKGREGKGRKGRKEGKKWAYGEGKEMGKGRGSGDGRHSPARPLA